MQDILGLDLPTFELLLAMPNPTPDQARCWLVYVDCTVRREVHGTYEKLEELGQVIRRAKYVGSSVDNRGGGFCIARHYGVAVSKTSAEVKQRHHEELCHIGSEANVKVLAAFGLDDHLKGYVQLLETVFMAFLGTFVGHERPGTHNPTACYDLYNRMRSEARIPEIEGDGLHGALSIYQGMAGLAIGRQMLFCVRRERKLPPNTSIRNASRLVEPGNLLGPRRCGPCERAFA